MNKLRCAILAAGDCTRLPNKLLLPTRYGSIVVHSAMKFAHEHVSIDAIHMVFKPGSLIETIFNVADDSHIRYGEVIHQIAAYGVCNALDLIYKFDSSCDWLVLLGDNYFGGHANLFPQSGKQALVGVVSVENIDENLLPHLDGYNRQQGEWLRRGSDIDYAIAGGYLLRPEHMQEAQHHNDLITYFNVINASMHELNTFGDWLDLGTPESYKQYWTGS